MGFHQYDSFSGPRIFVQCTCQLRGC